MFREVRLFGVEWNKVLGRFRRVGGNNRQDVKHIRMQNGSEHIRMKVSKWQNNRQDVRHVRMQNGSEHIRMKVSKWQNHCKVSFTEMTNNLLNI
jgi:hypothetical protein